MPSKRTNSRRRATSKAGRIQKNTGTNLRDVLNNELIRFAIILRLIDGDIRDILKVLVISTWPQESQLADLLKEIGELRMNGGRLDAEDFTEECKLRMPSDFELGVRSLRLNGVQLSVMERHLDPVSAHFVNLTTVTVRNVLGHLLDFRSFSALEHLDVADNLNLTNLYCPPGLVTLECSGCNIQALDLSGASRLRKLICAQNRIVRLDLTDCEALEEIYCPDNYIRRLLLPHNGTDSPLRLLNAQNNCMKDSPDFFEFVRIQYINLSDNLLEDCLCDSDMPFAIEDDEGFYLDISNNPRLGKIDLEECTMLRKLECGGCSRVRKLIVNPELNFLHCTGNSRLRVLDLRSCFNLQSVNAENCGDGRICIILNRHQRHLELRRDVGSILQYEDAEDDFID